MEQSRQIYSKFRKSENFFLKSFPKFIRSSLNSTCNYLNTRGINYITRLRLGLSYLCDRKFKHGFLDSLNSICSCGCGKQPVIFYSTASVS